MSWPGARNSGTPPTWGPANNLKLNHCCRFANNLLPLLISRGPKRNLNSVRSCGRHCLTRPQAGVGGSIWPEGAGERLDPHGPSARLIPHVTLALVLSRIAIGRVSLEQWQIARLDAGIPDCAGSKRVPVQRHRFGAQLGPARPRLAGPKWQASGQFGAKLAGAN